MKKVVALFFALTLPLMYLWAQEEEILLTIGDTPVTRAEFERIYKKNNENLYDETDRKTPGEYLDLFVDYKLKVLEAMRLKMDTAKSFREELAGYRNELAAPYLTDVQYNEQQVKKLYDRMTHEVNASHILLRLQPAATAQESRNVLEKINNIRKEILEGKDFNEAAKAYSEDPSAKMNGGSLGYFTAFQMVGPFEDAAFSLKPGEISEPVRTSFGYHLLKVHDVRANRGEVHVAHIMKMFPQQPGFDKSKLKAEIDSIHNLLVQGADFAEIARKHSDDKPSATQGGEMQWFAAGRMIPAFAEPAFNLENIGDITPPVETPYGYHIIKKLGQRPVPSFEEVKKEIEMRIKKDPSRSISSKKVFVEKLKKEYAYSENKENINLLKEKSIGDQVTDTAKVLFTIKGKEYNVASFNRFLNEQGISQGEYLLNWDNWVEAEITKLEDGLLEQKYPDFRYLVQEYHDGILLFNIMEEKIWNFAAQDTTGLEQFYNECREKHMWGDRFRGSIVVAANSDAREDADKYFASGMPAEEVVDLINEDGKEITIRTGVWEEGADEIVDYFVWNGPEPEGFNSELTFIRGDLEGPQPKTLEDARGLYISDYQTYLEKEWLKKLRKNYKIKVNKKLLKQIANG